MHKPLVIFLLIILFFSSDCFGSRGLSLKINKPTGEGKEIQLYKESHALLIGVSDYTNGWPDLESIPGEMTTLEEALISQGFDVEKVLNPNSRQLSDAFENFVDRYGYDKDNRLLFFFSGHGHSRKDGKKGYIVPSDAPLPITDEVGFLSKAVGMSKILTWARQIESKHALFLFDSCFSGTIFKTRALPKTAPHISSDIAKPVRQFITAGSAEEEVPARSIFVPSFARALHGEGDLNNDGYVTGTELGMYLHNKVTSYNSGQTPQYGKIRDPDLDEGDFVILVNPNSGHAIVEDQINVANELVEVDTTPGTVQFIGNGYLDDYFVYFSREKQFLGISFDNVAYKDQNKLFQLSKGFESLKVEEKGENLYAKFKLSNSILCKFDIVQINKKLAVKWSGVWPSMDYNNQNRHLEIKKALIQHSTKDVDTRTVKEAKIRILFSGQTDLSNIGLEGIDNGIFSFVVKNATFSNETEWLRYSDYVSIIPNGSGQDIKFNFDLDFKNPETIEFFYRKNEVYIQYNEEV